MTSAGLERLKAIPKLQKLEFTGHKLDDAGIAHIKKMTNLEWLVLAAAGLNDSQLGKLNSLPSLLTLHLHFNDITDVGLEHLKGCTNLTGLHLQATQVSDAGLKHLYAMKNLTGVVLTKTKVTAEGMAALHKALPGCRIEWDGGTIEPLADPDREAAEWVVSIGGKVGVTNATGYVDTATGAKLPPPPYHVHGVALESYKNLTEADTKRLGRLSELQVVGASRSPVSDTGLVHLVAGRKLVNLYLYATPVTDAGVVSLKDLPLTVLHIGATKITDKSAAIFASLGYLEELQLVQTEFTDQGLKELSALKNLRRLSVTDTRVTADGVAKLAKSLPQCKIEWDGGVIEPKK